MTAQAGARFVGTSVRRSEDPRILTGRGHYIDDVVLPGMVHATFVRSPLAHARITSIDVDEARSADGVLAVITGEEMKKLVTPGGYGISGLFGAADKPEYSALATDKVRYVGDPVAIVVARTRHLAEDAGELVVVEYDDLPPVTSIDQALDPSSAPVFEDLGSNVIVPARTAVFGDVDGAFARADRVVRARLAQHRYQNVPMECRGIVASFDTAAGTYLVWSANQGLQPYRKALAARLGVEPDKVRVRAGDIGGSFGLKTGATREDVCVAAASKVLGRPVKWCEDRFEHMCTAGQARDERYDLEAAVTNTGQILALRADMVIDAGSYPGLGPMVTEIARDMLPNAYRIGALAFTSSVVVTNKASYVAYRGPWASETFVRERLVDLIAGELGMDPLEVRRINLVARDEQGAVMATGRPLVGVAAREALERAAELIDVPAFRRRQQDARQQGRYLGLGFASFIEPAPGSRTRPDKPVGTEPMRMTLADDGHLVVFTGQMPHGQSHQTTLAQVAADEFGVPFDQVEVVVGDTDVVPSSLTGGSQSATMAGGAALITARSLRDKVLQAAEHLLEAGAADLEIRGGAVGVRGIVGTAIPLAELVAAAREPGRVPGDVDTTFEASETYDGGAGGWSGGTHAAIVEVDLTTGLVRFERYLAVEDCGDIINPAVVDGQIRGGIAQGMGAVLLERSAYDDEGQFLSATFMDYLLPTATTVPRIEVEHLPATHTDAKVNFRGVGEGGLIVSTPTICNAIEDALAPFGVRILQEYCPPSRLLELAGVIGAD